ncbi:MAG: beta-lactamase family protein [Prevotellaceae bacterium]|jgi:CubicO group peptidase (beta-lactamase class C family)|nr:beta-lactamase family protein [Prevotellaceae bacterium]
MSSLFKKKSAFIFLPLLVLAVLPCLLLMSYTTTEDTAVELSPFPLPPVPRLENWQSARAEFAKLDSEVDKFLRKWEIKGASVAIAKHGKLVYAKGFGYADVEQKVKVEPYHVFRIASISKLLTATAIMQLVEGKKLSLADTVFGPRGILRDSIFLKISDPRVMNVTVKNLLEHSSGWTTRYGDPMFMSTRIAAEQHKRLPITTDDIICFVLSKKMHYPTGDHCSYVNVGYAILGKIVEKASGAPYESYMQTHLLVPMGITSMCVGNSYPSSLYKDEVSYYDVWDAKNIPAFDNPKDYVPKPRGGYDIQTLGAAGGWVASPAELIRFILCIDENSDVPDILQPKSIDQMAHNDVGFDPLGWRAVSQKAWIRTGTLAGTSAIAVRDTSGYCWAFVTNTSSWRGAAFSNKIYGLINGVINTEGEKWKVNYDLFATPAAKMVAPAVKQDEKQD